MKAWAIRNPMMARVLLRLACRMGVALAIVVPLMPVAEYYAISPNVAAIAAVVIGLLVGAKLAERVAVAWALPPEQGGGDGRGG